MTTRELILGALTSRGCDPHEAGDRASARCPCPQHGAGRGDRSPSLSLKFLLDGTVLLYCHAACAPGDVVAALGLEVSDLFPHPGYRSRPRRRTSFTVVASPREALDHGQLDVVAARYRAALTDERLLQLASSLAVRPDSLRAFDVGWDSSGRCWTFPMRNGDGRLVGFRMRGRHGSKWTLGGTHQGLFLPTNLAGGGRLVFTEGPTDAAALLGLGIPAVGRPSCSGGDEHVLRLVRRLRITDAAIAADSDPVGQRGAHGLARALVLHVPVRVFTPPAKDVRAWVTAGPVVKADVEALIGSAAVHRLRDAVVTETGKSS